MTWPTRALPETRPTPQNDDAIADIQDFRQLVGDEDNAFAFGPKSPEDRQQLGDFARREIGGRLIEDQQTRVAEHRLEDLDPLPASERQVRDKRVRIKAEAIAKALLSHPPGHFAPAQDAASLRPAEHDVLDHRHRVHQHEMLMDHRDAAGHCIRWPVSQKLLPMKDDRPGVGRDEAEQHLHQRTLARAVLAQKAEDFPCVEIEINAVDRPHGAKAASDPAHFEKLAHRHQVRPDGGSSLSDGRRNITEIRRQPPLRASCSVGAIFSDPVLNSAAMSSSSLTTAAGTIGLNGFPGSYCSEAPVTGAVS